jgi:UDP-glucose 4-epimerase
VYVTDVCRAFLMAAESDVTGEVFNLGAGNPQSVNRLVELIGGEITYIPKRPGEPDCTWADIAKIQRMLGWAPETSFEDGVANMLRHIDDWKDAPVWNQASIEKATETWFKFLTR